MEKNYQSVLSEALQDLDTGSGEDNRKRIGIGKSIVALGMVIGDIGRKADDLNKNLSDFNTTSGRLQKWLILWTAAIALATVAALFRK